MSAATSAVAPAPAPAPRAIRIAVLAMGGEGGGVLADWLVDLAEHDGWTAQTTSVPGVAQRTGATIYYVEMFPARSAPDAPAHGKAPVLAMMPTPGDVDLVIASELMEAGRAMQRGLVTPERTTLVTSTHRVYSMTEKIAMGDGRVDSAAFIEAGRAAARRLVSADFAKLAEEARSVISSALFGAVAGSGVLPFARAHFEDAIRRGGIGVDASLKAFAAGFAVARDAAHSGAPGAAQEGAAGAAAPAAVPSAAQSAAQSAAPAAAKVGAGATAPGGLLAPLTARVRAEFPAAAHDTLFAAVVRLAEYQDVAYAAAYLDRLRPFAAVGDGRLLNEAARHLAVWMAYDDGIKVAQEKIRAVRFDGVAKDVRQGADQLIAIREFLHPRVEEVADILPAAIGRWLLKSSFAAGFFGKPKVVTTTSLRGFLSLWLVAALRPLRRGSLRFQREDAQIGDWLERLAALAGEDYELAVAFARAPRLIKGYGDTHLRGHRNLAAVVAALPAVRRQAQPAAALGALIAAALADEEGKSLKTALQGMGA